MLNIVKYLMSRQGVWIGNWVYRVLETRTTSNYDRFTIFFHGVRLSPLGTAATVWPIVPATDDDDGDCGAIGGMRIGTVSRRTWRKPAPVSLCRPQIANDPTRAWTRAAAVGSRRLTAWAMTRPCRSTNSHPLQFTVARVGVAVRYLVTYSQRRRFLSFCPGGRPSHI
jgi:hypothetical protein